MKLVVFLMLTAILLCCYAGCGCKLLENIIVQTISPFGNNTSNTINPTVSLSQYQEIIKPFVYYYFTRDAVGQIKQCFLNQTNATLANVQLIMKAF
ncbi:mammaglobin-A-like [Castor canadensis]|uniref:Mammaglobin-A-like n=1 Tax=Castor canadensis TaxID=51338 RepID=A0AC58LTN6_CASCN